MTRSTTTTMIVDLSAAQVDAVTTALSRCGLSWATERWFPAWALKAGTVQTHECVMPAIGWRLTLSALVELSVGPRGGNRRDVKECALNARQRIARALSTYAAHPALYGVGLIDNHGEVLPVWRIPPDHQEMAGPRYDLYPPINKAGFTHLIPEFDGRFTTWTEVTPIPLWEDWDESPPTVLNPNEHLNFFPEWTRASREDQG